MRENCSSMKKNILTLVLAFVTLLSSCQKEMPKEQYNDNKELVEYKGETVSLDLQGDTEDLLKGMVFDISNGGRPKIKVMQPDSKVKVLCVFRKVGDVATTTYKELEWTVDATGRKIFYKGDIKLASSGFTKADNGKWYMTAIVGGTPKDVNVADATSKAKVEFNTPQVALPLNNAVELNVPYILPWTAISTSEKDGSAVQKDLLFQSQGTILKVQLRNGMISPYKLKTLHISSGKFYTHGGFDLSNITDDMLTKRATPAWLPSDMSKNYQMKDVKRSEYSHVVSSGGGQLWDISMWHDRADESFEEISTPNAYTSYNLPNPITVASAEETTAFYTWVMPAKVNTISTMPTMAYADVQGTQAGDVESKRVPVFFSTDTPRKGTYRTINLELTSDLMILSVLADAKDSKWATPPPRRPGRPYRPVSDGSGVQVEENASVLVLYNPTVYPIDLTDYALVRGGNYRKNPSRPRGIPDETYYTENGYKFYVHSPSQRHAGYPPSMTSGKWTGIPYTDDPMQATALPLRAALGDHRLFEGKFSTWPEAGRGDLSDYADGGEGGFNRDERYKLLAGTQPTLANGQIMLQPGKCIVLVGGGYLLPDYASNYESIRAKNELLMQAIKMAVDKGYCQFAFAYSNGEKAYEGFISAAYEGQGGTLDLGAGQGFFLIKHYYARSGQQTSRYRIVDSSIPYKQSYVGSSQYKTDIRAWITAMSTDRYIDVEGPVSHVRKSVSRFPLIHPVQYLDPTNHHMMHWTISKSSDYPSLFSFDGKPLSASTPSWVAPQVPNTWSNRWVNRR